MIRPVTLVTMAMAALSGAYLFGVKHRAQVLDDQLAAVTQASRLDDQRIAVLQAQWSLEIDHNRLQALTAKFSGLQAMKPSQLVTLTALSHSLPPAGAVAPEENPVAPVMPAVAAAASAEMADAAPAGQTALPLPPPEAPVLAPDIAKVILASVEAPAPRRHGMRTVARVGAKNPRMDESELADNAPMGRLAAMAPAAPVGAKMVAVNAVSSDGGGQGGSMLGMAADLAPPQPLAPGASN